MPRYRRPSSGDATVTHLRDCHDDSSQQRTHTSDDLAKVYSGKCLDVTGNVSTNGTRLQL
ncbi:RICIN domain-containing protein [Actinomadura fibrosa]|uniref:RICIN domain-containing protein n=1 Tax=Actinomadura fibrosa TaxID=111802 RepID=A0ABW2XDU7_9ACTN|nr:RICIN domain-containing protein [Actinomadura fibrosa]